MRYLILIIIAGAALSIAPYAYSGDAHDHGNKDEAKKASTIVAEPVNVGNKTCPVMGSPVNGQDFVEYKGKRYGLCCAGCKGTFLKDPEKYIKLLNEREK